MVVDTCYKNYNNDNSNYGVFTVFLHGSYTSVKKKYIYYIILAELPGLKGHVRSAIDIMGNQRKPMK